MIKTKKLIKSRSQMHLSILSPKIIFFVSVGRFKFQLLHLFFFLADSWVK